MHLYLVAERDADDEEDEYEEEGAEEYDEAAGGEGEVCETAACLTCGQLLVCPYSQLPLLYSVAGGV